MKKLLLSLAFLFSLSAPVAAQQVDLTCSPPGTTSPVSCRTLGLGNAGYPVGATPYFQSATGTTAGATATAPGVANQFTYLCGYAIDPGSATAAITVPVTSTGLGSNNLSLHVGAPATAGGTTGTVLQSPQLGPCPRSTAVNTGISLTAGALGAGGVNQGVNMWGYYQ